MSRYVMRLFAVALGVVSAAAALPGCATNPATGRTQWDVMSRAEEIELGEAAQGELVDGYGGRVRDESLQQYMTRVGMSMVPHTEADYPSLPWEFTLLESDVINAFALPGGKVFMTRGLAERLENEAQMAGVLGHEIGHVTAEHADKRVGNQLLISGIVIGAAVAAGQSDEDWVSAGVPLLVGAGGTAFALKFGRNEELEADALGMRYMSRAGYNPRGQLGVMQILAGASEGPRGPEFLSTHPYPETRIDRIRKRLQDEYPEADSGRYAFYEERFESEFLAPLRRYQPTQPVGMRRGFERFGAGLAHASLMSGCAHCAMIAAGGEAGPVR
ncbi:MAG: M48 family metalloprotease [Planctomycetota bacterium]|nr:M48 family metalloprotease [Planctomycetota bacterium]